MLLKYAHLTQRSIHTCLTHSYASHIALHSWWRQGCRKGPGHGVRVMWLWQRNLGGVPGFSSTLYLRRTCAINIPFFRIGMHQEITSGNGVLVTEKNGKSASLVRAYCYHDTWGFIASDGRATLLILYSVSSNKIRWRLWWWHRICFAVRELHVDSSGASIW